MTSLPDIITRLPAGAGDVRDIKELVKRLRAEEGRMVKLFDLATVCRDKHRGHASFADFNDIKHGISGRDPVLTEAADALEALERERDEARQALRPFAVALDVAKSHIDRPVTLAVLAQIAFYYINYVHLNRASQVLSTISKDEAAEDGSSKTPELIIIDHDGFVGTPIGYYERVDGKRGAVLQQNGCNVVHVYGEKWFDPAEFSEIVKRFAPAVENANGYTPQIIRNEDGGVAELVLRDVACVYGEQRTCRVIRDMNTGEEIGFQWDIPEDRTNG